MPAATPYCEPAKPQVIVATRVDVLTDNVHAYLGKGRCPAV